MSNSRRLTAYLEDSENGILPISYFKKIFTPLNLAKELEVFTKADIIEIDWEKKNIIYKSDLKGNFHKRHTTRREINETPDYMKVDKLEKNKPFI